MGEGTQPGRRLEGQFRPRDKGWSVGKSPGSRMGLRTGGWGLGGGGGGGAGRAWALGWECKGCGESLR